MNILKSHSGSKLKGVDHFRKKTKTLYRVVIEIKKPACAGFLIRKLLSWQLLACKKLLDHPQ
jgi:hypothetical protein